MARDDARAPDAADLLAPLRAQFDIPAGVLYLDGNSLGVLPRAAPERVAQVVRREWGEGLIRSWNSAGWMELPQRVGDKIARLVGARAGELVVTDSTSVNLFKVLSAALAIAAADAPARKVIVSERHNFPTDLYMIESAIGTLGQSHRLELAPRDEIIARITPDTALVLLTHVHYKTAEVHDMAAITAAAHAQGALVLWDLSHSAGAIPVDLNGSGADFAVGCGYKFLNGGPGAPAYLFVAERHHGRVHSPLGGWMGHARPFAFVDQYEAGNGMARFLCGTPPVLAFAALEVGVDLHGDTSMAVLAQKSQQLAALFIRAVTSRCAEYGVALVGPPPGAARGSHVSLAHPHGYEIMQALIARGVIGDFRAPDIMRFGLTPLYLRYADVVHAAAELHDVLFTSAWQDPAFRVRHAVT